MKGEQIRIPLDCPEAFHEEYRKNFQEATHGTGRLMLFAGDQKVEHLNDDFYGTSDLGPIPEEDNDPEHLFRIASRSRIGIFAAQLGLISFYGMDYRDVPYLIKLNSKTHLVKPKQMDPMSAQWINIEQVVRFKQQSGLKILGVGYTIYLGSEYEPQALKEAAQIIFQAHSHGLLTVLWIYPRGKAVSDEKDPHLIAGATGVAACLGSDFVKVNYPKKEATEQKEIFKEAIQAAGRCRVICAGGSSSDARHFLRQLHDQIFVSGALGNATGRNVHQKPLDEAVRMCNAISAITLDEQSADDAYQIFLGK